MILKEKVFSRDCKAIFAHQYLAADENVQFSLLLTSVALSPAKEAEWKTNVKDFSCVTMFQFYLPIGTVSLIKKDTIDKLDMSRKIKGSNIHDLQKLTFYGFSRINRIVERFPGSKFGSYPSWVNQYYKTRISFECPTLQELGKSRYNCANLFLLTF